MDLDANKKFYLIWFMSKLLNKTFSNDIHIGATIFTERGMMVYTGNKWANVS